MSGEKKHIIKKIIKLFIVAVLLVKLFLYFYTPNKLIIVSNFSIDDIDPAPLELEISINGKLMDTIIFNNIGLRIIDYDRQYRPVSHLHIVNKTSGISEDIYYNDFLSKWIVIDVYKDGFSFHRHWFPPFLQ